VHYIDSGVDTGDIISQRRFPVDLTDTGGVLHEKITRGLIELFKDTWPRIKDGSATRTAQNHSEGTHHRKGDLGAIDEIHLDRNYRAADLLNLLRARTYPPYPAAYAIENGQCSYYRINYAIERDARPQRNERATKFTLKQEFTGREFIALLATSSESLTYPAYFEQPFGRIYTRTVPVDQSLINRNANPPWTQDHIARLEMMAAAARSAGQA
jgi:methionyl-tRNA formyltransferase